MTASNAAKGLVALVTGGASGLGRGAVEHLSKIGYKVAILDLPVSKGQELAQQCGQDVLFTPADVTSEEQVKKALDNIKEKFGRLDALVNCAGIAYAFKIYHISKKEICPTDKVKRTLDVNIWGTINVINQSIPLFMDKSNEEANTNGRGVIVNTASIAAYDGQTGQFAYAATKGAIAAMTLPLARDLAEGPAIRVMTIAPGLFDTPILQALPFKVKQFVQTLVPYPQRLGNVEEFAALVQHIIENRYLNGEVIRLDGALRMPP